MAKSIKKRLRVAPCRWIRLIRRIRRWQHWIRRQVAPPRGTVAGPKAVVRLYGLPFLLWRSHQK